MTITAPTRWVSTEGAFFVQSRFRLVSFTDDAVIERVSFIATLIVQFHLILHVEDRVSLGGVHLGPHPLPIASDRPSSEWVHWSRSDPWSADWATIQF